MKSIVIQSGATTAHVRADLGGCIEGLWFNGIPVLRSHAPGTLHQVRSSGCYPLVPFSNRVAQAKLQWNGTSHPLVKNFGDEDHAIHGVGWQRAWQVLDAQADFAMLSLEHKPDAAWPFAFDASQTFRLKNNALEMTLSITNQSPGDAPVGLGWHPYFSKRADTHIAFSATGFWKMSADKLPTTRMASTGLNQECTALDIDNCFDGWAGNVVLRDSALRVQMQSDLQHLVVFTNASKDFCAVEPVSHVNNAMNQPRPQELGIKILGAGQTWQAAMSIGMEPA